MKLAIRENQKNKEYPKRIILLFLILSSLLGAEVRYDGLFFLGFNLQRPIFQGKQGKVNRKYIACNVSRKFQELNYFEEPKRALSFTYPLSDYHPTADIFLEINSKNISSNVKQIKFLYSSGVETKKIAKIIIEQLVTNNMIVQQQIVTLDEKSSWSQALQQKDYDIFLMGFKAEKRDSAFTFLKPLYGSQGYANFMSYTNPQLDLLIKDIRWKKVEDQAILLKIIDRIIYRDLPLLPLYYIEEI